MEFEEWMDAVTKASEQCGWPIDAHVKALAHDAWKAALTHAAGICRQPAPECCGRFVPDENSLNDICCGNYEPWPLDAEECARAIEAERDREGDKHGT